MAEAKKTAKSTQAATPRIEVPSQVIDFQKRVLNGQRALFDTTYNAVSAFQDNQAKAWNGLLEGASFVPTQVREISEAWSETRRESRESYKRVVDKSFTLAEEWVEGLSGSA